MGPVKKTTLYIRHFVYVYNIPRTMCMKMCRYRSIFKWRPLLQADYQARIKLNSCNRRQRIYFGGRETSQIVKLHHLTYNSFWQKYWKLSNNAKRLLTRMQHLSEQYADISRPNLSKQTDFILLLCYFFFLKNAVFLFKQSDKEIEWYLSYER